MMNICQDCRTSTEEDVCPECKAQILSDPDEIIDRMVERASIPNLGALLRKGKKRGFIQPQQEYGHTA